MTYRLFNEIKKHLQSENKWLDKEDRYLISNISKMIESCKVIPEYYNEKIEQLKDKHKIII